MRTVGIRFILIPLLQLLLPSGVVVMRTSVFAGALQPPSPLNRRNFLITTAASTSAAVVGLTTMTTAPSLAGAAEGDLASQLYNPDGSLKDNVQKEAKERTLTFNWNVNADTQSNIVQMDGSFITGQAAATSTIESESSSHVQITYTLPDKWITTPQGDPYIDTTEGINQKAVNHIYVYQVPVQDAKQLEKASQLGVASALQLRSAAALSEVAAALQSADLISGRKVAKQGGQKKDGGGSEDPPSVYFEFDMAAAPLTCSSSSPSDKNNLGLGFCPYNTVFLLSATILNEKNLYVMIMECDNIQWKQASADLKRIRSSFKVTTT